MHGRSKRVDVRFHFLQDLAKDGVIELLYYNTQDQIADIMTKPLKADVFLKLRKQLECVVYRDKLTACCSSV